MFPERFYEITEGIRTMQIRGAGLIARTASEGLQVASESIDSTDSDHFWGQLKKAARLLLETRPTAVSLPNALRFILRGVKRRYDAGGSVAEIRRATTEASEEFIESSLSAVDKIGIIGAGRLEDGDTVLTHCNSQAVNSVIGRAHGTGISIQLYVTESRPRYQGLITARQLSELGIPVTLIVDSSARYFMSRIDKVIVGADALASNGAVINKIGTSSIALAAREARVRFMVAAETYKFSPETFLGGLVEIEERPVEEVVSTDWLKKHSGVRVLNPAFDVTPPEYVDAIITEVGIASPYTFLFLAQERYGWTLEEAEPWV
ncbi:MAG: ribose 1,5-bisphosphate isomerase [Candidatus Geothermarchaeales archaeon]